jgi:hypothetical protein
MLATFPLLHVTTGLLAITAINWINFPYSQTTKQLKGLYHLPKQLKDLMACYWSVAVLICAVRSCSQLPTRSTSSSSISLLQPQWLYIYKSFITHRVRVARVTWDLGLARWGECSWLSRAGRGEVSVHGSLEQGEETPIGRRGGKFWGGHRPSSPAGRSRRAICPPDDAINRYVIRWIDPFFSRSWTPPLKSYVGSFFVFSFLGASGRGRGTDCRVGMYVVHGQDQDGETSCIGGECLLVGMRLRRFVDWNELISRQTRSTWCRRRTCVGDSWRAGGWRYEPRDAISYFSERNVTLLFDEHSKACSWGLAGLCLSSEATIQFACHFRHLHVLAELTWCNDLTHVTVIHPGCCCLPAVVMYDFHVTIMHFWNV